MIDKLKMYGIKHLYHFTDRKNINSIKERGLLSYSKILDSGIICYRSSSEISAMLDALYGLNNYIHICFRPNHPMYYKLVKNEGRDLIWIGINIEVLNNKNVLFTTDVANKTGIKPMAITDADKIINYKEIFSSPNLTNMDDIKRVSKYEILVPDIIPITMTTIKKNFRK